MFLQRNILLTLAGIALTAAACGGSSSGGGGTQTVDAGSGAGTTKAAVVTTHSGPDGAYLTDASGRTLYIFAKDKGAKSTCSGDCAKEWPAFTSAAAAKATGSATGSMLGTSPRDDGSTQVTYAGHPLYYFSGDSSAGDMNGQGEDDFGGLWTAVTPDGSPLSAAEPSSSPSDGGSSYEWG